MMKRQYCNINNNDNTNPNNSLIFPINNWYKQMVYKSKTIHKDLNPFWDEKFYITVEDLNLPLELKVCQLYFM